MPCIMTVSEQIAVETHFILEESLSWIAGLKFDNIKRVLVTLISWNEKNQVVNNLIETKKRIE